MVNKYYSSHHHFPVTSLSRAQLIIPSCTQYIYVTDPLQTKSSMSRFSCGRCCCYSLLLKCIQQRSELGKRNRDCFDTIVRSNQTHQMCIYVSSRPCYISIERFCENQIEQRASRYIYLLVVWMINGNLLVLYIRQVRAHRGLASNAVVGVMFAVNGNHR